MDGDQGEHFEFLRDTQSGDTFVRVPQDGPRVQLRFLDSVPGDPDGVLTYDADTFRRLRRAGILESMYCPVVGDS